MKKLIDVSFYIMMSGACLAVGLSVINIIFGIHFLLTNTINMNLFIYSFVLMGIGWGIMLFGMVTNIWIGEDKELNRRIVEML